MLPSKLNTIQEIQALLNCRRLPGRLGPAEAAAIIGVQVHDIATLSAEKLLTPLGRPAPNGPKYFASIDIIALAQDKEWLSKATRALTKKWQERNIKKVRKMRAVGDINKGRSE
jgi:hypothetical protein